MQRILIAFTVGLAAATASPSDQSPPPMTAKSVWQDAKAYYTAPLSWRKHHWGRVALVSMGAALAYGVEEDLRDYLRDHRSDERRTVAKLGRSWTEFTVSGPLILGLYGTGWALERPHLRQAGFAMLESVALGLLTTNMLKYSFQRCRPLESENHDRWFDRDCDVSFPSGHSTVAFALAASLDKSFPNRGWRLKLPVYSLAVAGVYQRLYHHKHWFSDTVIGAAIGYFTADFIVHRRQGKNPRHGFIAAPGAFGWYIRW